VDFILVRGGVVTGRVTTADGRPLIAGVITIQVIDEQGHKRDASGAQNVMDMMTNSSMYQTDDRGVYRIFGLRAGRYVVSAGGDSNMAIGLLTGAGAALPRTWHPDAVEENQATIIKVDAGGEVTGIDIRLGSVDRAYEALGRVVDDETGNPIAGVNVICVKIRGGAEFVVNGGFAGNTKSDEQGNFRLSALASGEYQLSLVDYEAFLSGGGDHYSDGVKFEIQSADVAGVEVRAKHGATISGVAIIEDADPSAKQALSQTMIMAMPPTLEWNRANGNEIASPITPALSADLSDGIPVTGRENITGVRIILGKN
jgi:hypothetical protein